ncbi:MAG: N-acetyl-alpha-D-glucosaminyl L-malate synthase BshA [Flavicella sp.]
MKIGIVCYPTFGGSGVVATELGKALALKGHEIHFITYNQPVRLDYLSSGLHFHQVQIQEYPLFEYQPYELALSSKMVAIVLKHNLDILHVHYAIPHAYAAFMAKQILKGQGVDVKVVTTLHGTDITLVGSHPSYKTAVEFSINNSDVVTTVSNSLRKQTLELFAINKEIKVIYNFIEIDKYPIIGSEDCQRSSIAQKEERILTHISNFRPVKRISDVIEIFYKVQQKIPSKLLLVGEGPDLTAARRQVKKYKIEEKVLFLGNSVEIEKILCYTDVFLLPSQTESFGLAALEAMAARSAVISSQAGGLSEVNDHGKTGFLSPVGDTDDMAKHAIYMLEDFDRLQTFKNTAYEHSKKFSLEEILPEYENIYDGLIKKNKS